NCHIQLGKSRTMKLHLKHLFAGALLLTVGCMAQASQPKLTLALNKLRFDQNQTLARLFPALREKVHSFGHELADCYNASLDNHLTVDILITPSMLTKYLCTISAMWLLKISTKRSLSSRATLTILCTSTS